VKLFPVVKKIINVVSGGGNGMIASVVNAGIAFSNRFTLNGADVTPAIAVDVTRQSARINQNPGIDTDLLGATGDPAKPAQSPAIDIDANYHVAAASSTPQNPAVDIDASLRDVAATTTQQKPAIAGSLVGASGSNNKPAQNPAFAQSTVISDFKMPETPACEIVQVVYDLNRRVGSNAVTNTGAQTWTNPTNAQGIHDGSNATHAGNLTAAHTAILSCEYVNHTNKTALTITQVNLHFYVSQSGTVLNNGDLRLRYNIGVGDVTLETITGDVSSLTTPRTFDITTAIGGDWSKLDALRTLVEHRTDIAENLINAACDAVELEIVASATQIP
jgi:hypothetical protein